MEIDACSVTQIQSHRYSIEGAEKPVSGVNPACEEDYTIEAFWTQLVWPYLLRPGREGQAEGREGQEGRERPGRLRGSCACASSSS